MQERYFSLAMRSAVSRSRASEIFDTTYWPATYATARAPAPTAKLVLFRRSQRLVAEIMIACGLVWWLWGWD